MEEGHFPEVDDTVVVEVTTTGVVGALFLDIFDLVVVLVTTTRVEGALSVGAGDTVVVEVTTARDEGTLFSDVRDLVVVLVTTTRVEGALSVGVVDVVRTGIQAITTEERGLVVLTTTTVDTGTEVVLMLALWLEEALAVEVEETVIVVELRWEQ